MGPAGPGFPGTSSAGSWTLGGACEGPGQKVTQIGGGGGETEGEQAPFPGQSPEEQEGGRGTPLGKETQVRSQPRSRPVRRDLRYLPSLGLN